MSAPAPGPPSAQPAQPPIGNSPPPEQNAPPSQAKPQPSATKDDKSLKAMGAGIGVDIESMMDLDKNKLESAMQVFLLTTFLILLIASILESALWGQTYHFFDFFIRS